MKLDVQIGNKLQELRGDLSVREAARRIGIDHSYLSKIEKGKVPSLEMLKKICDFYGISVGSLFGDEVEVPNELEKLGVKWAAFSQDMEKQNLSPDDVKKMVEVIKSLKSL